MFLGSKEILPEIVHTSGVLLTSAVRSGICGLLAKRKSTQLATADIALWNLLVVSVSAVMLFGCWAAGSDLSGSRPAR